MWFNGLNELVSKGESAKERLQSALIGQSENISTEESSPEEKMGASGSSWQGQAY